MNPEPDFWKGRRVLITGHTGFKGAWLTLWLARLGADVTGLSLPPEVSPNLFTLAVRPHHATSIFRDIRDLAATLSAVAEVRPEIVFHLAAQSLVPRSYRDPVATYATNIMGTVHVLEAIRRTDSVRAIVVVTSDKCYENVESHQPYSEDAPLGGTDPYSSSKSCAELVTRAYRTSFFSNAGEPRCNVATARAGNVIGGGDWSDDRLIPDLVRAVSADTSAAIRNPAAVRPWQLVLEPLAGYLMLAERLASGRGHEFAEAWNFGPSEEDCRPVSYLIERFLAGWGNASRWYPAPTGDAPETHILKIDASKAAARLGWQPRVRLDAAIDWTLDWYRQEIGGADAEAISMDQIDRYEETRVFPG